MEGGYSSPLVLFAVSDAMLSRNKGGAEEGNREGMRDRGRERRAGATAGRREGKVKGRKGRKEVRENKQAKDVLALRE